MNNGHHHLNTPRACIIWLHGLGANAENMEILARQLLIPETQHLHHVFLDAPYRSISINAGLRMQAWFNIFGMGPSVTQDHQGIHESQQQILTAIEQQMVSGFASHTIFLAGFSQGGAMALYTAIHFAQPLAGVISLSGFLPLAENCQAKINKKTPFFIAKGQFDSIVLPLWTQASIHWLLQHDYQDIFSQEYPMEHTVCEQELIDLSHWLHQQLLSSTQKVNK